jgi:hypothetical protein
MHRRRANPHPPRENEETRRQASTEFAADVHKNLLMIGGEERCRLISRKDIVDVARRAEDAAKEPFSYAR